MAIAAKAIAGRVSWCLLLAAAFSGLGLNVESIVACRAECISRPGTDACRERRSLETAAVLQSGSISYPTVFNVSDAAFPLWQAGLLGDGQVVGMADSGLDYSNCFFNDPGNPEPGPLHRKVLAWRTLSSDDADVSGHGTHTAGALVGASLNRGSPSAYNGMAPRAKMVFTDLGSQNAGREVIRDSTGWGELFQWSYKWGARIHSDSWGGSKYTYDQDCVEVDAFLWRHLDFVSVVAAGNDGLQIESRSTIGSPGSAKNVIAVGATLGLTGVPRGPDVGLSDDMMMFDASLISPGMLEVLRIVAWSGNGGPSFDTLANGIYPLLLMSSLGGCVSSSSILQSGVMQLQGAIVMVELSGSNCSLSAAASSAAAAGALALLLYPSGSLSFGFPDLRVALGGQSFGIPLGAVSFGMASVANRSAKQGASLQLLLQKRATLSTLPFDDVARFSGFGPTTDGRIKPDIVTVGDNVVAAKADTQCGVDTRSGTSSAAPLIAGGLLLLREYFVKGYYARLWPPNSTAASLNPSGALLKAVLLNGAVDMLGLAENGMPLESTPSYRQGWGRAQLDLAVPLVPLGIGSSSDIPNADGSSGLASVFQLWVADWQGVANGQVLEYCITTPQLPIDEDVLQLPSNEVDVGVWNVPISATLTWYDPPSTPDALLNLVNDLDLELIVPQGALNGSRGGAPYPDRVNTVERVRVPFPLAGGRYQVQVIGRSITQPHPDYYPATPFAIVVSGPAGMEVCDCQKQEQCSCSGC